MPQAITGARRPGHKPRHAQGRVGAYVNPVPFGLGSTAKNDALDSWAAVLGRPVPVSRQYAGSLGGTTPPATVAAFGGQLSNMLAAGRQVCLSFQPHINPATTTDHDALDAFFTDVETVAGVASAGQAVAGVAFWHEPTLKNTNDPGYFSVAQFIAAYAAGTGSYADVARAHGVKVVFCTSEGSVHNSNENQYYPGDANCDVIATDFYAQNYVNGHRLGAVDSTYADYYCEHDETGAVHAGNKPFAIWECFSSTDGGVGQTQAQATDFWHHIRDTMQGRLVSGLPCGDICVFNSDTVLAQETPCTSGSDYRVALIDDLIDVLNG